MLDVHVSGRRIGPALRRLGHDVRPAYEERELDGCSDDQLLALATADGRVLVTCDVGDFAVITTAWAAAGRRHAGCAILVGIRNDEFGLIVRRLSAALDERAEAADWADYTAYVSRRGTSS